jgi:hypothetical protein
MCYIRDLHAVKFNRVLYEVRQYAHAQAFAPVLLEFMRHTRDEDSPVWQATTDGADLESDEVLDFVAAKLQRLAKKHNAEAERLDAEEQAEAHAEAKRLEASPNSHAHTKRARTEAIAV